jgi:hypothetical protein
MSARRRFAKGLARPETSVTQDTSAIEQFPSIVRHSLTAQDLSSGSLGSFLDAPLSAESFARKISSILGYF